MTSVLYEIARATNGGPRFERTPKPAAEIRTIQSSHAAPLGHRNLGGPGRTIARSHYRETRSRLRREHNQPTSDFWPVVGLALRTGMHATSEIRSSSALAHGNCANLPVSGHGSTPRRARAEAALTDGRFTPRRSRRSKRRRTLDSTKKTRRPGHFDFPQTACIPNGYNFCVYKAYSQFILFQTGRMH